MSDKVWGKLISLNNKWPHVDLSEEEVVIGRVPECTIPFPTQKVISSKHCKIYKDEDGVIFVEDTSSNGTFVNGKKIGQKNKISVKDGDEISLIVPNSLKALQSTQFREGYISFIFRDVTAKTDNKKEVERLYDIRQELGTGTFATVYLGVNRSTGEMVAIKTIDKKKFALNPSLRKEQITDEAKIMKSIKHPHILAVKDIFYEEDFVYMILELATGGDLFDAIVNKSFYPEGEARIVFGQLASAVGYLHNRGIAHRDLKPENILLNSNGDIKLSDFGLSRIIGEEQLMKTLCGTPKYLAPEIIFQSEGVQEVGYSKVVDCWSMGVILYCLVAGFPPFGDDSFEEIKKGEYDFDDDQFKVVSDEVKDLITKLLTVNPSKRYTVDQIFEHPWMKSFKRVHGDNEHEPIRTEPVTTTTKATNSPKKIRKADSDGETERTNKKQKTKAKKT